MMLVWIGLEWETRVRDLFRGVLPAVS
jgi:hypothetical protein